MKAYAKQEIETLLLEDSDLDAELTLARLERAGLPLRVRRVLTRADYMQALRDKRYDLILADFNLPDFDGIDALDMARRLSPNTPFILVSGMLGEELAVESLKRGATDYVLKQRLDRLPLAVERALSERWVESRLEESELRYSALLEAIRDFAIVSMDAGGLLTTWNSGAERLFGYAEAEIVGSPASIIFAEEDIQAGVPEAERSNALATGTALDERWHRRKDSSLFWASGALTPIRSPAGKLTGFVKVLRDCTDARRAEEERLELLRREKEARQEAERRAEEVSRANSELQQFAFAVSHDLQEPLRMVSTYTQLVERRVAPQLEAEASQWLKYIVDGARRMQQLLEGLREYLDVGRDLVEEPQLVDSTAALNTALDNLRQAIEENSARVTREALPKVPCREIHLVQLFQNLVGNAIKYHSPDQPPCIHVSAQRRGPYWEFSVRDNGIGVDPQYARLIFGMFKRLHGRDTPGAGIGLAICEKVVKRYGGRIWVESKRGQGSTFHFTLPAP
ncbi:MAG: ATP-binding protein [Bryobacteraceae bacterium]|nr:ATP-binding protein [Bryobacteraceae bacterium]